jgi:hypothetical protein
VELLSAVRGGTCVAFVGAGFSAAAGLPSWSELLTRIAEHPDVEASTRAHVLGRVGVGSAHALDEAAQALEDARGAGWLLEQLRQQLHPAELPERMTRRLDWLSGIPFRAVLTTNFDGILPGRVADQATYATALRARAPSRWHPQFWPGRVLGPGALKLHGDLQQRDSPIVLTRRDYRRRLYHEAGYSTFLKALLATTTFVYLGFSFEDAYLNELRSETLALLGHEPASGPLAYAIVNDVSPETVEHFRRHEGIEVLTHSTARSGGEPDFSGFDEYLEAIFNETNPVISFGRHLERRRILWVDPNPQDAGELAGFFELASQRAGREVPAIVLAGSASEAMRILDARAEPFSLIITHWGEGLAEDGRGNPTSTAERLLRYVRERDVQSPVLVFAAVEPDIRKPIALRMGALDYCIRYESLLDRVDEVFSPGQDTA